MSLSPPPLILEPNGRPLATAVVGRSLLHGRDLVMLRIQKSTRYHRNLTAWILVTGLSVPGSAQLSSSAYRELGQVDFRQNGVNRVQGSELGQPAGIALDARDGRLHVYVADTGNHRVMAWEDAASAQSGAPASLV